MDASIETGRPAASLQQAVFVGARQPIRDFVRDLPPGVDPCGENGEYHSFVFDAPYFSQPIAVQRGELVRRTYQSPTGNAGSGAADDPFAAGFWYCDLLLGNGPAT